jgi:arylsulfatase A
MKHKNAFLMLLSVASMQAMAEKPNIVFILADDWGWTDWQMNGDPNGSTFYETPNLNKLAQEGVFFSQAYATPLCSPSRAALLTGKYPGARFSLFQAITGNSVPNPTLPATAGENKKTCFPESRDNLPLDEITIAEELKNAGYKTFQFGKWHLGSSKYYPVNQGFQTQFAVGGAGPGSGGYFAPYGGLSDIAQGPDGEYITDRLTDEVCNKMEQVKNDNFFIYFSHYNVHSPYEGKADLVAKYAAKAANDPANRHRHPTMGAMIESLDVSVGKVMNKLNELGIAEKTILIVMGDNGGIHWANDNNPNYSNVPVTSNYPLRAGKSCFYEGGVRVPLLIKYPAMIDSGKIENTPVHLVDFYPTLLELAGTTVSSSKDVMDGKSIVPLLSGKGIFAERPIFCHFPRPSQVGADVGGSYIRFGDYKLCRMYGLNADASDAYELYNIKNDISESIDSAKYLPEKVNELKLLLNNWLIETKALVPHPNPLWTGATAVVVDAPVDLKAQIETPDALTLSWVDNSDNEKGFIVFRSESDTSHWVPIDTVPINESEFIDNTLTGMKYYFYKVCAYYIDSISGYSNTIAGRLTKMNDILPDPWQSVQFGTIAAQSFAEFNNNVFTVDAADYDAWANEDRIHFIYRPVSTTNFEMSVNVLQLDNVASYAQGGIMFRETLDAGSKHVSMFLSGDKRKIVRERVETDGVTNQKPLSATVISNPYWLKLVRNGNTFSGYHSSNGVNWSLERSVSVAMNENFYVGLASASHDFNKSAIIKYGSLTYTPITSIEKRVSENHNIWVDIASKILHIDDLTYNEEVRVYDIFGQLVVSGHSGNIDVSGLNSGLYVVVVSNEVSKVFIY